MCTARFGRIHRRDTEVTSVGRGDWGAPLRPQSRCHHLLRCYCWHIGPYAFGSARVQRLRSALGTTPFVRDKFVGMTGH